MHIEYAIKQLNKKGEELCGDNVGVIKNKDNTIFVLSDGLGSGVKANILSTMTKQIALTMLSNDMDIEDVVETIANTLPVCKVRNIAYSTFTIVQIFDDQRVKVVEFDNPAVFYIKDNKVQALDSRTLNIADKEIQISDFQISDGDYLVVISDGVVNAGLGKLTRFGWSWESIAEYLQKNLNDEIDSDLIAERLGYIANELSEGEIGDDTSVLVIKTREKRNLVVSIGPPADKEKDCEIVSQVLNFPGRKIICGGTTANIFSRCLNKDIKVNIKDYGAGVPPKAEMDGFDLVTEGIVTLTKALEEMQQPETSYVVKKKPENDFKQAYEAADYIDTILNKTAIMKSINKDNPAKELVYELEKADKIKFIVGTAINPAYKELDTPVESKLKLKLVMDISEKLKENNKEVEIAYF